MDIFCNFFSPFSLLLIPYTMISYKVFLLPLLFFVLQDAGSQSNYFRSSSRLILGTEKNRSASVSIGDLDGDGDLDVAVANGRHWPQQNQLFFNNGQGIFTVSQPLGIQAETSYAAELADFDNDGDLDIAVGNDMAPNTLFFNGGKSFTRLDLNSENFNTYDIVTGDLNGDGQPDIIEANSDEWNRYYFNTIK